MLRPETETYLTDAFRHDNASPLIRASAAICCELAAIREVLERLVPRPVEAGGEHVGEHAEPAGPQMPA